MLTHTTRSLALLIVLLGPAAADRKSVIGELDPSTMNTADHGKRLHLLMFGDETTSEPDKVDLGPYMIWDPVKPVTASAGTATWMAAGLYHGATGADADFIAREKKNAEHAPPLHVTGLVDGDQPIFLHVGFTDRDAGHGYSTMSEEIDDAAKPAVELFRKTLGDPKALAATVSSRSDVVLLGTGATERFVGTSAVSAALVKWGMSFTVVGGVMAGATKSKTIVWIAADVDGRVKTATKPEPYKLTVIYEKTATGWKIVQLHFT